MERSTSIQQDDISPPRVFISSTFENLLQDIRDALKNELEDYDYHPVMSELGTFSYTYGRAPVFTDTIQAVRTCQFYVLVVGRRYGTRHPKHPDRSITELEYEEALSNNLPILVYVHKQVWEGFKAYKQGAISARRHNYWVDEPAVFEFLDRVAERDSQRCVSFSSGQEIIDDFRKQCANYFGAFLRFDLKAAAWLWNEWKTRSVERNAASVWIITPNFYWDYQDPEFHEIVFKNVVERETRYYYIYRETQENRNRIAEMVADYEREIGEKWKERVHYLGIPNDQFHWCTEQIIFNPEGGRGEHGIIVDIMDSRDKRNKYNIELGRLKRSDFHRQFKTIWNDKVTNKDWIIS